MAVSDSKTSEVMTVPLQHFSCIFAERGSLAVTRLQCLHMKTLYAKFGDRCSVSLSVFWIDVSGDVVFWEGGLLSRSLLGVKSWLLV